MGRWWGLGRSPQPAPKVVSLQAAPNSGWRALAPITPTLGPPAATAPLREFTSGLTTSINPGLIAPAAPLSVDQSGPLTVLRMISESVPDSPPAQPMPTAAPRSRRWSPKLPLQLTPDDSADS